MKNLILILVALFIVSVSFSQNAKYNGTKEDVRAAKESGVYEFTLPQGVEEAEVTKNAGYYTDYFDVEYNNESRVAKISMKDNDEMGRRVINRFLLSNGAKHIEIEGEEFTLSKFFNSFMR